MFSTFRKALDTLIDLLSAAILAFIVLVTLWQVLNRYVLATSYPWTVELCQMLFPWFSLLAAARVAGMRKHFDISLLTEHFPKRVQLILQTGSDILIMIFLWVALVWGVRFLAIASRRMILTVGVSQKWLYLAVPISAALMIIYQAGLIYEDFRQFSRDSDSINIG